MPSAEDLRNDPHGHLVWAARKGDVAAIRTLAARGVDLNASSVTERTFIFPDIDHARWTALQHAVQKQQAEAVRVLLQWGAEPDATPPGSVATPLFIAGPQRLAELSLTHKLPFVFGPKDGVEAGGLMSYSPNRADYYRRGAIYVDKILKGANPADLPVEQPTRFQLVVNFKTAKALGLTIPESFLSRVDEVIE